MTLHDNLRGHALHHYLLTLCRVCPKAAAEVAAAFEEEEQKQRILLSPKSNTSRRTDEHTFDAGEDSDDVDSLPTIAQVKSASSPGPVAIPHLSKKVLEAIPNGRSNESGLDSLSTVAMSDVDDSDSEIDPNFRQVSKTTKLHLTTGTVASNAAGGLPVSVEEVEVGVDQVVHFRITVQEAHVSAAIVFRRAAGGGSEYELLPKTFGYVRSCVRCPREPSNRLFVCGPPT